MNSVEILKLVKRKLFEPKKKIVYDVNGNKILALKKFGDSSMSLSEIDSNLLAENDGWNIADKDFVESKILDLNKQILQLTNMTAMCPPSAPKLELLEKKSNSNKFMLVSRGELSNNEDDTINFFYPGLILKKNTVILDCIIVPSNPLETFDFIILNNQDNKILFEQKIKNVGTDVIGCKISHKLDSVKNIIFKIKGVIKPTTINLQIYILE